MTNPWDATEMIVVFDSGTHRAPWTCLKVEGAFRTMVFRDVGERC